MPFDCVGLVLLVLWVGALQIMIDKGKELDWFGSTQIVALAVVAAVGFLYFLAWELTEKHPIVNLRLFARRNFLVGTVALSVGYGLFFGNVVLLPLWLQQWMGYTATWAGLAMAPVGLLAIVLSPWVGKNVARSTRASSRRWRFVGFALVLWMRSNFNTNATVWVILMPTLLQGAAMAFFFIPLQAIVFSGLTPEELPSASGMSNFVRITAGAFGTSVFTTLWDSRASLHHAQLAESFHRGNDAAMQALSRLGASGLSPEQAQAVLNRMVDQQAYTMAATDLFYLSALLFLGLIALVWLAQPRRSAPRPPTPAARTDRRATPLKPQPSCRWPAETANAARRSSAAPTRRRCAASRARGDAARAARRRKPPPRPAPDDFRVHRQLHQTLPGEIDEQQASAWMQGQVAERVEHVVAREIRHRQRVDTVRIAIDAHEAGLATAVRHVHAVGRAALELARRHAAGDEVGVGLAHQRHARGVQRRPDDARRARTPAPPIHCAWRAWMYLGQLPKLCRTAISKPLACNADTMPFRRLRRRVCGSMPSTPSEAPTEAPASADRPRAATPRWPACGRWESARNPAGPPTTTPAVGRRRRRCRPARMAACRTVRGAGRASGRA